MDLTVESGEGLTRLCWRKIQKVQCCRGRPQGIAHAHQRKGSAKGCPHHLRTEASLLHGLGRLIRGIVGLTLAVNLGWGHAATCLSCCVWPIPCGQPWVGPRCNLLKLLRMGDPLRSPWMRVHSSISFIRQQSLESVGCPPRFSFFWRACSPGFLNNE